VYLKVTVLFVSSSFQKRNCTIERDYRSYFYTILATVNHLNKIILTAITEQK